MLSEQQWTTIDNTVLIALINNVNFIVITLQSLVQFVCPYFLHKILNFWKDSFTGRLTGMWLTASCTRLGMHGVWLLAVTALSILTWSSLSENMGAITNESHAQCVVNSQPMGYRLLMPTPACITSKHLCTAGLYAAHDPYHIRTLSLPCVKLSPTCHAALGRCGEARGKATHMT